MRKRMFLVSCGSDLKGFLTQTVDIWFDFFFFNMPTSSLLLPITPLWDIIQLCTHFEHFQPKMSSFSQFPDILSSAINLDWKVWNENIHTTRSDHPFPFFFLYHLSPYTAKFLYFRWKMLKGTLCLESRPDKVSIAWIYYPSAVFY